MHRKSKFSPVHTTKTITVPRCQIGTFIRTASGILHTRNSRKFGKHRRGTLVLHKFDGTQDTNTGVWTVVMEFRNYKGNKIQVYSREQDAFVEVSMPVYPYNDFRDLFR